MLMAIWMAPGLEKHATYDSYIWTLIIYFFFFILWLIFLRFYVRLGYVRLGLGVESDDSLLELAEKHPLKFLRHIICSICIGGKNQESRSERDVTSDPPHSL